MASNNGRTLSDEEKEQFAYEIALGYFDEDQLRRRFKLAPAAFVMYCNSEEVHDLVLSKKREVDESDFALKVHARRAARVALEEYIKIVQDKEAPAKTRMEAGKQIREIASGVDKAALGGGAADEGGAVIIRTNLDLEGAKGVYAVSAADIREQMKDRPAEISAVISAPLDPEIMALLGE